MMGQSAAQLGCVRGTGVFKNFEVGDCQTTDDTQQPSTTEEK